MYKTPIFLELTTWSGVQDMKMSHFHRECWGLTPGLGGGTQNEAGWSKKASRETVPELNSDGKVSKRRTFQVEGTTCANTQ